MVPHLIYTIGINKLHAFLITIWEQIKQFVAKGEENRQHLKLEWSNNRLKIVISSHRYLVEQVITKIDNSRDEVDQLKFLNFVFEQVLPVCDTIRLIKGKKNLYYLISAKNISVIFELPRSAYKDRGINKLLRPLPKQDRRRLKNEEGTDLYIVTLPKDATCLANFADHFFNHCYHYQKQPYSFLLS